MMGDGGSFVRGRSLLRAFRDPRRLTRLRSTQHVSLRLRSRVFRCFPLPCGDAVRRVQQAVGIVVPVVLGECRHSRLRVPVLFGRKTPSEVMPPCGRMRARQI